MTEYGFSLTVFSLFKDRIKDSLYETRINPEIRILAYFVQSYLQSIFYMLPINIFKGCRKLRSLESVFGGTAHISGALKKFLHLSS